MNSADKPIDSHFFEFNPEDNGGESLYLSTKVYDNGDKKNNIYLNQEFTLNSYSNSATFLLFGAVLTPKNLRKLANKLANELEKVLKKHKFKE